MIRPFNLRDMPLIHRLGERGTILQTQAALTSIPHPVRRALAHLLVGGRYITYVWKSDHGNAAAFAQLFWREGDASAYLIGLGVTPPRNESDPVDASQQDNWLKLFDELIKEAGKLGVHNLVAEANEDGPELDILRKSGFVVYTRQDIWIADRTIEDERSVTLQTSRSIDEWDINILYSNSIPGLLHSIEPQPPLSFGQNWILREKNGELAAYVHMNTGTIASWMQLFIHPNAETKPREIVKAALDIILPTPELPIYCCVRRYQSWLLAALEKAGFHPWGSQAVLVKQIVQPVKHRTPALQDVLQTQTVSGSSPVIQGFSPPNGRNGIY